MINLPSSSYDFMFMHENLIRRFGNLTATSTSEVLLAARSYVEQSSQAQRSVVSTSAEDADADGKIGIKKVRICY